MDSEQERYKNNKIIVKKWESKFKEKEGRNPTKEDIKMAPQEIRNAYRIYWVLKMSVLENAILCDNESDNCTPSNNTILCDNKSDNCAPSNDTVLYDNESENCASSNGTILCDNESENCTSSSNTILHDKKSDNYTLSNISLECNNLSWGEHLNKPKTTEKRKLLGRSFSFQFAEKLFKGSNFNKRNPRRTRSFAYSKSVDNGTLTFMMKTDDENSQSDSIISTNLEAKTDNSFMKNGLEVELSGSSNVLDVGTILDISDNRKLMLCTQTTVEDNGPLTTVVENCQNNAKLKICRQSMVAHPISVLQRALESDEIEHRVSERKLDNGWLERCNQNCLFVDTDTTSTFSTDKTNPNPTNKSKHTDKFVTYSDDDLVYCSDDENSKIHICEKSTGKRLQDEDENRSHKRIKKDFCNTQLSLQDEHKRKILEEKVCTGKANENFVSINIKKKIFVRGKKTMTSTKYKKQQWKMKKKLLNGAGTSAGKYSHGEELSKCFKCGDVGHFSRNCRQNMLLPKEEDEEIDNSPFPTLEEAAEMANEQKTNSLNLFNVVQVECNVEMDLEEYDAKTIKPLYSSNEDGSVIGTPEEVFKVLSDFGYQNFHPGQEEAIMRILSGMSTLIVLSTGAGKSLCYQIPAYLYAKQRQCITLVISPLVSLMEDQIDGIPTMLRAACLHTNQTDKQRELVVDQLKKGDISILLVSPEAIVNSESGYLGRNILKHLPPISFACIDEVHCVSQWSHNFRPSYLLLCKVLREKFHVKTFLGLTATATKTTIASIADTLSSTDNKCNVIQYTPFPNNLMISVSRDEDRDNALVSLLESKPFSDYQSIIIYCIRRNECERVASYIRTRLRDIGKANRSRLSSEAEAYHAGLTGFKRKRVQKAFMSGNLRIVVATVAFGMGINKCDIRGVIHYNMPRTFEHYVQEVGRAGRDGSPAHCHLFIDHQGKDLSELGRHIYADSLDRHTIRKLLQRVFIPCKCQNICEKHEVAFSVEDAIKFLDLPQENISTLLCYLELHPKKWIQVLQPVYTMCNIQSYSGILALKKAAKSCPPLAAAIAIEQAKNSCQFKSRKFQFSIINIANRLKWDSGHVKRYLKNCEWTKENGKSKKTGILVDFHELGFRVSAAGNLNADELDEVLDALYARVQSQESSAVTQLQIAFESFNSVAYVSVEETSNNTEDEIQTRSDKLKHLIKQYFQEEEEFPITKVERQLNDEDRISCDIHRLVSSYKDCSFTGRIIARIFHGIESPNYPATIWGRSPFWRLHLKQDFNLLYNFATIELLKLR